MMPSTNRIDATRLFLRTLNISLKFVRLYGFDHARTSEQLQATWNQLRAALAAGGEDGLLIGASEAQLLLDGATVQQTPVERSVAQLLTGAGVDSVQFLPGVTQEELGRFVRAFSAGSAKTPATGEQLGAAFADNGGIHIRPMGLVAEDPFPGETREEAPAAKKPLPTEDQNRTWQGDPEKLPQRLASSRTARRKAEDASPYSGAADEDTVRGAAATEANVYGTREPMRSGTAINEPVPSAGDTSASEERHGPDEEILSALRLLTQVAQASGDGTTSQAGLEMLRQALDKIPERPRQLLQQALATLAGQMLTLRSNDPVLLRLAEHLAVRFALDRSERGADAASMWSLLHRMSKEIHPLRELQGLDAKKMAQAGIRMEIPADLLDRQFWSAVPKSRVRAVITSPEAWCVPPRNIRQQIEEMAREGEPAAAGALESYARAVNHRNGVARGRAAAGLAELADLYAEGEARALITAIRCVGAQLSTERDDEAQGVISCAFERLTEQAAVHRLYGAVLQSLNSLDSVEDQRPAFAQGLRGHLDLEKHIGELLEEAIRTMPSYPDGLRDVIERMPRSTTEYLRSRFNRTTQREECRRIVGVARQAGAEMIASLRDSLRSGPPTEAAESVGLLSRLDPAAVEQGLGSRLAEWPRLAQDRAVRLLADSDVPERGRLLLGIFDGLDPVLQTLAVDEIGMSGESSAVGRLLRMATGDLPKGTGEFLRLKAVEALGRLRAREAIEVLRGIVEARKMWRWLHSSELRIAAMTALREVAPDWARDFLPHGGFSPEDLEFAPHGDSSASPWFRQRRYPRVRLSGALPATATSERGTVSLEVRDLSLSGGLANGKRPITPGTQVVLRLGSGVHPVRALGVVRGMRTQDLSFEFSDMELDERARLRRLIREHGVPASAGHHRPQGGAQPGGMVS